MASKGNSDLVKRSKGKKGGLKTMPFIIANEAFERLASIGLIANMVLYLTKEYHWENATAASILFWWLGISNFMPLFGAFVADSYLGRYYVIALGTFTSLTGLVVLWLTAILKEARPPSCNSEAGICSKPSSGQAALLFASFALLSLGTGCIRPCSVAFGADQLNNTGNPENGRILQSFFNWYYAFVGISMLISVTVVVYIQGQFGWVVGLGVPAGLMLLAAIMFLLGSSLFIRIKAHKSLLTSFSQVITAAWKNKHLALHSNEQYHHVKGSRLSIPTDKLRFINKACIIRNPAQDLKADGTASEPWKLCTVEQVEAFKVLLKIFPMWSANIMVAVTFSHHAFATLQATTMDRHLAGNFKIPAGSFSSFAIIILTLWIAIYDRILVPRIAKFTKNPRGLSFKQRMGIGILFSCAAQAVSALVEKKRRAQALREGLMNHPFAQVNMSALWLVPQYSLIGLAEGFNAVGQTEFYYSQFPKSMASIGVALFPMGMGVGNFVGSLIVQTVKYGSTRGGKESWLSNNLNLGHYDYYYWVIFLLSVVNFLYFMLCAWAYGSPEEQQRMWDVDQGEKEEEMLVMV